MYICQGPWNREFRGGTEAGIHNRFHDYGHVRAVHILHFPNQTLPSVLGVEGYLEGTPIFVRLEDPEAHGWQGAGPPVRSVQPKQLDLEVSLGQLGLEPQRGSGELALG